MRLIDADRLMEELMRYVISGRASNMEDCAEFNSMVKNMPTVETYKLPYTGEWSEDADESVTCASCTKTIYKPYIRDNGTILRYNPYRCPFCGEEIK